MSIAPLLNAAKYLPASVVLKGLEKINPKFKNFFSQAASYGIDANRALDYLTKKFSNNEYEEELEKGTSKGTLRPDEAEAKQAIEGSNLPGKALRGALAFGGAALLGSGEGQSEEQHQPVNEPQGEKLGPQTQAQEIAPRISQIAQNVREAPAQSKINPMNPANMAAQAGENVRTGLAKQALKGATGAANLISQFPELGKYLDQLIQAGNPPEQAAVQAKSVKKFASQIQAIEQKVGDKFENIISQLFGNTEQVKNPPQTAQKSSQGRDRLASVMERREQRKGKS